MVPSAEGTTVFIEGIEQNTVLKTYTLYQMVNFIHFILFDSDYVDNFSILIRIPGYV